MSDFETIIRNPKEFGDRLLDLKNKKKYCDAEIVVHTERIPAHRIVLASSSAYFEKIFSDNESLAEKELDNTDVETVQLLLEYCYTGTIRVSKKNLQKIMLLAIFLKITLIIEGCENIYKKIMDSSNCIWAWKLAKSENLDNLKNFAFEYAKRNFEKVSQSSEFSNLNDSEISELLSSDIIVANETIVFDSVKKWISHDNASRKQHLDKLLKHVRFEHLPGTILSGSQLQSFCSVNSSTECSNKILNAQRWKNEKKSMPSDENLRDSYNTLTVVGSGNFNTPKTMEIFDLKNEKWTNIENFECDRNLFSAVMLKDKLMLIGGINNASTIVNTVQSYDLKTGIMENLPPMKYQRYRLSTAEFKGRVYAIGGWDGYDSLTFVEMWDPASRQWNECTPMPTPRRGCEAKVFNDEIFVVGGKDESCLSVTESYNPETDKWKKCASMNEERHAPGVTVIGNYFYVVGGINADDVCLNTAEKYDYKTDKWTMIHSSHNINAWMGSGNLFGKFVIVGGTSSEANIWSTMEMYDDENDTWIFMPSLNEPRRMLRAVEVPWLLARAILSRENPK